MSKRKVSEFEIALQNDSSPPKDFMQVGLEACPSIRAMRGPTRGRLSIALHELPSEARVGVTNDEISNSVRNDVRSAREMRESNFLNAANEAKLVVSFHQVNRKSCWKLCEVMCWDAMAH